MSRTKIDQAGLDALYLQWVLNAGAQYSLMSDKAEGSGRDMSGCSLQYRVLHRLSFHDCTLPSLINCTINHCNFVNCKFPPQEKYEGSLFRDCNFVGCDMSESNMRKTTIHGGCFSGTNMSNANFRDSAMSEVRMMYPSNKLDGILLPNYQRCPEKGSFVAYKKVRSPLVPDLGAVLELLVPETAKRQCVWGLNKFRVSEATPVAAYVGTARTLLGPEHTKFHSVHDRNFVYTVGEKAVPSGFDRSFLTCSVPGIHCFLTYEEALNY